ncbi:MAG: glucose-1-phosphate adenylyltransferase [Aureliella sp.]
MTINPKSVLALILGGGRGSRLFPLTQVRAKPSVPLAAKYRLIDIPISNCINSNINKIFVLTQFLSNSLHRHIRQTYSFDHFSGGFVELLAAQQTMSGGTDWYEGTADAVRKNLDHLDQRGVEYILILSGDQLYRMDYEKMLDTHIKTGADATIAAIPVDQKEVHALGVMRCDETGKVTGFLEKPQTEEEVNLVKMDPKWIDSQGVDSGGRECLASMGLYIFNRDLLFEVLEKTDYQDFGKEVFPAAIRSKKVHVHLFDDYWEDIGTIRAFYEANLQLAREDAPFDLVAPDAPVYSRPRYLPPAIIDGAHIEGSLIADGCRIGKGTKIENSVIGLRCSIGENVTIKDSIVMGTDYFESDEVIAQEAAAGRPPAGIGDGSTIVGTILDKNCRVGKNVTINNKSKVETSDDRDPLLIRDGIPILTKEAKLPDGWTLE